MKSLKELEKEWDAAAKNLQEKRVACHKADNERELAVQRHSKARKEYQAEFEKQSGLNSDIDPDDE